ncbi:MAG: hypothetical protein RMM98_04080 [Acidobacteriota bacterium]|nr:hypothetical protein [Blastocatellia bacterium]MDW8238769.1 hypothetical protein [Acidobacteriota bacterium]
MKQIIGLTKRIIGLTLALTLLMGGSPALNLTEPVQADWGFRISFDFFYHRLRPYGRWIYVPRYGQVWYPVGVGRYWQPYSNGYWVYTEFGWTWVSYDDFGWIPYHYGAWTLLPIYGWVWVPGYVWAPAWVTWRYGPHYIGWAPLPPGYSFFYGGACPSVVVIDRSWVFVPSGSIGYSDIGDVRIPYEQYGEAISGTDPMTNLIIEKDHIFNPGPGGAPGGEQVGGEQLAGESRIGKFNLTRLKLSQLGVKPQPIGELRSSGRVDVATPFKERTLPDPSRNPFKGQMRDEYNPKAGLTPRTDGEKALPEPIRGSFKGQMRDEHNPKAGLTPRMDGNHEKHSPIIRGEYPGVGTSTEAGRDEKYNAPRTGAPQVRPGRDDKYNAPTSQRAPKSESPQYEPRSRSEKPSPELWQRMQPRPQPRQYPKVTDQPRRWDQPFEQDQPRYKSSPSPRPDTFPSAPPSQDPRVYKRSSPSWPSGSPPTAQPPQKSSPRSPVIQVPREGLEKTPRHIYQPPMKSPSAWPSAPGPTVPRSSGSSTKPRP